MEDEEENYTIQKRRQHERQQQQQPQTAETGSIEKYILPTPKSSFRRASGSWSSSSTKYFTGKFKVFVFPFPTSALYAISVAVVGNDDDA